ncbi:MAG: DNA methyltransferase, partial [Gemmatimonadales bacterium]
VGARQAKWPEVDYIIGNPPYLGRPKKRDALGDGYVDALKTAYPTVSEDVDFVMYWWWLASLAVGGSAPRRAGLITTNSLRQLRNREVISMARRTGVQLVWVIADHPWVDDTAGAAVRVAMSVLGQARTAGLTEVLTVDERANVVSRTVTVVHDDLRRGVDVAAAAAVPLQANRGLSSQGFKVAGRGFVLTCAEATNIRSMDERYRSVVRPLLSGRDITTRLSHSFVLDFGLLDDSHARSYEVPFQIAYDRVHNVRQGRRSESQRTAWWRFDRPRPELRTALSALRRYFATPEVSRHRIFVSEPVDTAPDGTIVAVALDDSFSYGVLLSSTHTLWSLRASGTLEDRPRYNKSLAFDAFPFPDPVSHKRERVGQIAEQIDVHRRAALARDDRVTMTGLYNIIEKNRTGVPLSVKERTIHEVAACSVLQELHDELDALVAEAYGWPWPIEGEDMLERLVALHDERVEEEKSGLIRWLRPDYQIPRFAPAAAAAELALTKEITATPSQGVATVMAWPSSAVEQLSAIKSVAARVGTDSTAILSAFIKANEPLVRRHLETLTMMGEL